jgi:hypothetical protein
MAMNPIWRISTSLLVSNCLAQAEALMRGPQPG